MVIGVRRAAEVADPEETADLIRASIERYRVAG